MDRTEVQIPEMLDLVAKVLRPFTFSSEAVNLVARNLVRASLTGHDSHGLSLLPIYVRALHKGNATRAQVPQLTMDAGPLLKFDCLGGLGQIMMNQVMALVLERAKTQRFCIFAATGSFHIGRLGSLGEDCVRAGKVGIFFCNVYGSRANVAPWGGVDGRTGTNPVCIAFPFGGGDLIADFATSEFSVGKVRVAADEGKTLPAPGLITADGVLTDDPRTCFDKNQPSFLLSMGRHKGSNLGFMCDLLAGCLTGGHAWNESLFKEDNAHNNVFGFVMDKDVFTANETIDAEVARYIEWFKSAKQIPGQQIYVPGEVEKERARIEATGRMQINSLLLNEIRALAQTMNS